MLEDPGLDTRELADALRAAWAVEASAFTFVPGYDMRAATYQVATSDASVFLKVRFVPDRRRPSRCRVPARGRRPECPRADTDAHIRLWHAMGDGHPLVLYPFVSGQNAMLVAMTADQWRTFGSTTHPRGSSVSGHPGCREYVLNG